MLFITNIDITVAFTSSGLIKNEGTVNNWEFHFLPPPRCQFPDSVILKGVSDGLMA